jgi:hypothetical protein
MAVCAQAINPSFGKIASVQANLILRKALRYFIRGLFDIIFPDAEL